MGTVCAARPQSAWRTVANMVDPEPENYGRISARYVHKHTPDAQRGELWRAINGALLPPSGRGAF
jgi:hypothetical protein